METLANWIKRCGVLPPTDAVAWAVRLCKHLESMHASGVAHGNISPGCILAGDVDPRSRGMMADVRRTSESASYHSPERVTGAGISTADDTWAVAATLYTLLTGTAPFTGADRRDLEQQILRATPRALSIYGIKDDQMEAVLTEAFHPSLSRRLWAIRPLRVRLEELLPLGSSYPPLEDEDAADEASATFNASATDRMVRPKQLEDENSRPTQQPPPAVGEQDETVMRELPAHIMAMAARAAAGSNPPEVPESNPGRSSNPRDSLADTISHDDPDATRIALGPSQADVASRIGQTAARIAGTQGFSKGARVLQPPRPRQGVVDSPVRAQDAAGEILVSSGPSMITGPGGVAHPQPMPAPLPGDDDEEGERTILIEAPLRPALGASGDPRWTPAPPPQQGPGQPAAAMHPRTQMSAFYAPNAAGPILGSSGQEAAAELQQGDVSGLIQETLDAMGRSGTFVDRSNGVDAPLTAALQPPNSSHRQAQPQTLLDTAAPPFIPGGGPSATPTASDEFELMRRGRGTGRLLFLCFVALVLAAAATFALLKLGPQYGIHVPLP